MSLNSSFLSLNSRYTRAGLDPIMRTAGWHQEERRTARTGRLGTGTLACGRCDAPIALGGRTIQPMDKLTCPFCDHRAPAKEFLSLDQPTRPARVEVRVRTITANDAASKSRNAAR